MGVLGLSAFITDQKSKLLRRHRLHSTKLVIDANNLCHYLYYNFRLKVQYGGDYDQFAKHLKAFFQNLQECKIEPVMIFDGAYNEDDRKFQTTLNRFRTRLMNVRKITRGSYTGVLPILARQVFVAVLKDLGIVSLTCDFEADDVLASVANFYECPVLSNDSDFYIYDLKAGFVPLDFLDITKHTKDDISFIEVKIYRIEWLFESFRCKDRRLAGLLAVIIGNDFVSASNFENFYSMMNLPNKRIPVILGKTKNRIMVSRSKCRIGRILEWFENAESFDYVFDKLISAAKTSGYGDLNELVMRNVNMYSVQDTGMLDYIKTGVITAENCGLYDRVPLRFLEAFRQSEVEPDMFNSVLVKRVMLMTQVENLNESSSYQCSQTLRRIIYGFMSEDDVVEYDRDRMNVIKRDVMPLRGLSNGKTIPRFKDTSQFDNDKLRDMFISYLSLNHTVSDFHDEIDIFLRVISYWVRNSNPRPNMEVVKAVLLSFIRIHLLESIRNSCNKGDTCTLPNGESCKISAVEFHAIIQKFVKIKSTDYFDAEKSLPILHAMAQFQACYMSVSQLSQLLNQYGSLPRPDRFFNGLLIHNLCAELGRRRSAAMFDEELLRAGDEALIRFYRSMCDKVMSQCGEDTPITSDTGKNKGGRRKRARKKKKRNQENEEDEQSSNDTSENKQEDFQFNCELSNKFGMLSTGD